MSKLMCELWAHKWREQTEWEKRIGIRVCQRCGYDEPTENTAFHVLLGFGTGLMQAGYGLDCRPAGFISTSECF